MIRLVVAEDHELIRRGIQKLVAGFPDIEIVGESETMEETLSLIQRLSPDVLSLDLGLRDGNGVEVLHRLRSGFPSLKILVLTMHEEDRWAVRAIKEGARAYITKAMAAEDYVNAVRAVAEGRHFLTPRVAELLVRNANSDQKLLPHEELTPRELDVFRLLGNGLKPKQAAAALGISLSSVNTYRSRIAMKTGLKTSGDIIRYTILECEFRDK